MQKAPEIHVKYDPVLRIKSYEKNTRNFCGFSFELKSEIHTVNILGIFTI